MSSRTLEKIDTILHRLHTPHFLMGRICDEYDRRMFGEDDE